jgi:hypothetical protein
MLHTIAGALSLIALLGCRGPAATGPPVAAEL